MKNFRSFFLPVIAVALGGLFIFLTACEISNGDETVRSVSLRVAGVYTNASGIASRQSGGTITSLNISQNGDQLNAIDNLGARWTGTIGRADGNTASVNLDGLTNTGVRVIITGNITIDGTSGTLRGTWVEPVLRSDVFAQASVAAQPTVTPTDAPTPTGTPTVTATPTGTPTVTPTPTVTLPPIP